MDEEQTRRRIQGVSGPVKPTTFERDLIQEAMWAEYERPSSLGPVELIDASARSTGEQLRSSWHQRGVLLATVAAGLLLLGGVIGFNQRQIADRSAPADAVRLNEDPVPLERSDTIARRWGPVDVTFALPAGRTKESSTENSVLLGSRLRSTPETMQGRIMVAFVHDLQIREAPIGEFGDPGVVQSFSISADTATIFAMADGGDLVFEAGSVNEVDVYRLSGTDHAIIVWAANDSGTTRDTLILPDLQIAQG